MICHSWPIYVKYSTVLITNLVPSFLLAVSKWHAIFSEERNKKNKRKRQLRSRVCVCFLILFFFLFLKNDDKLVKNVCFFLVPESSCIWLCHLFDRCEAPQACDVAELNAHHRIFEPFSSSSKRIIFSISKMMWCS